MSANLPSRWLLLAALLAVATGCASHSYTTGTPGLNSEVVNRQVINGRTTKAQVIALLGEPRSKSSASLALPVAAATMPAESWVYTKTFHRDAADHGGFGAAYAQAYRTGSSFDRVETSVLVVMFNAKGVVVGHTFNESTSGAHS